MKGNEIISIETHNKDIAWFSRQIKTADQIAFADPEISRIASLILQNGGSQVQLKGINTQALVAQQRMNGAEVSGKIVQSPLYEHCLDSIQIILRKFGNVNNIFTDAAEIPCEPKGGDWWKKSLQKNKTR